MRKMLNWKSIVGTTLAVIVSVTLGVGLYVTSPHISYQGGYLSIGLFGAETALASPPSGFGYCKQITISGTVDGAQTDYQMRLVAYKGHGTDSGNEVYLNNHVQEDFDDIRFTETDDTALIYWLEDIVESFDESGNCTPFYNSKIYPQAIRYNGVVYVVFQGDDKDPYIRAYNIAADTWAGPVKIGTNPLVDNTDGQGAPAVMVDDSGYIHVAAWCHNTSLKYWISDSSEDISAFSAQSDITAYASYPRWIKDSSGNLYIFYRGHTADADNYYQSYRVSDDEGDSWGSENIIIDYGTTPYLSYASNCEYDATNGRIHFGWSRSDEYDIVRLHIYHAYLKVADSHMYDMAANDLGTTISEAEGDSNCRIVNSGSDERNNPTLHLDSSGNPYMIYPAEDSATWKCGFVYYAAGWQSEDMIATINDKYSWQDFIVNSSSDIEAYITVGGASESSGDMVKYTWDGEDWSLDSTIADAEEVSNPFPYNKPKAVVNCDNSLRMLFCSTAWGGDEMGGEGEHDDNNKGLFGLDSNDNFVGQKAIVWVKFDSIAASPGSSYFYMYYGNESAVSASDGEATFLFFDDFPGSSIDTDKWDGDTGDTSVADSILTFACSEDNLAIYADDVWGEGIRYRMSAKWPMTQADSPSTYVGIYAAGGDSDDRLRMTDHEDYETLHIRTSKDNVDTSADSGLPMFTYWGILEMLWQTSGTDRASFSAQGRDFVHITTNVPTVDLSPYIEIWDEEAETSEIEIDWIFIGKFTETEPTWGEWGSEQEVEADISNTPATWSFGSVLPNITVWSSGSEPSWPLTDGDAYFTVTNNSGFAVDIGISCTNFNGGVTITLAGSPGTNICSVISYKEGDGSGDGLTLTTSNQPFIDALADSADIDWELKFMSPTEYTDSVGKSGTVTLLAGAD